MRQQILHLIHTCTLRRSWVGASLIWLGVSAACLAWQVSLAGSSDALANGSESVEAVALPLPTASTQLSRRTCEAQAVYQQFDFWVGEWEVTAAGKVIAQSSIQKIVGSCIIYETYSQPDGYTGKSFNFYDATLQQWRQTWVDSTGSVSEFVGVVKDGAMYYEGESHRQNGNRILRKMILTPMSADKVRQYSEFSADGGKTWQVMYDFLYLRKK